MAENGIDEKLAGAITDSLRIIATRMRACDVALIVVEYHGCRGDGDVSVCAPDTLADELVIVPIAHFEHSKGDTFTKVVPQTMLLREAMEAIFDNILDLQGHRGWMNDDGGGGELRVHSDGTTQLEHYTLSRNYVMATVCGKQEPLTSTGPTLLQVLETGTPATDTVGLGF